MRPTAIHVTAPQAGPEVSLVGDTYRILVSGEQTGGAYALIDMLVPPGGGPGPHAHAGFQEAFHVLEGEVVFRSETQTYTAQKGAVVDIPTGGAIHSFTNESNALAHLLCLVVPAGLDRFFLEIGQLVQNGALLSRPELKPEDLARLQKIGEAYGQEFFPPDYLSQKQGG
ncbi:cupin domain-containing protein [Hymenobacter terrestris]|uniref:Cupin domain-containing protein n=1 Tax=Hymenobacter terrestris TaxID=2748310 RepID=A0ABX2Q7V6_9BACT|nr:cupin domain-containing protein [Hymenobacter terrestris]NVO86327.1 cupin domain-containing protein [Hymenobacter terrestris]